MGFDGSSITGFQKIEESDMVIKPDPTTFRIIPWRQQENAVARMIGDIQNPDGSPYEGDPRQVLKKNLARIKDKGYTFYVGPELEFFYFKNEGATEILDKGGWQEERLLQRWGQVPPIGRGQVLCRRTAEARSRDHCGH